MGIGTLGFLKGASRTALDSITAREEAETQLKKQKQLEQFRADLEQTKAMSIATNFTRETGEDGQTYIQGRNRDQQAIPGNRRLETADETEAFNRGVKKEQLSIDSAEANIRNTNDQIRSRGVSDTLDAQYKRAAIANLGRDRESSSSDGRASGAQDVASMIRNDYSDLIKEFVDTDMSGAMDNDGKAITNRPMEYITSLSEEASARALREARDGKKDSSWMYSRAREIFNQGLINKSTNRDRVLNPTATKKGK